MCNTQWSVHTPNGFVWKRRPRAHNIACRRNPEYTICWSGKLVHQVRPKWLESVSCVMGGPITRLGFAERCARSVL